MLDPKQYRLLDFGNGEKLEQFGETIVRRQTPSVDKRQPKSVDVHWHSDLRFSKVDGAGRWRGNPLPDWTINHLRKRFRLKTAPSGQVGIFPEQAENWNWIETLTGQLDGLRALNLFGYTGGTTLALADRGVDVVHVDASKSVVKWARENAAESNMAHLPIRWIVEDAMKFVHRQVKRKSRFEILVADPPSFGRGPNNEHWKLERDLEPLLQALSTIASNDLKAILLTSHTPGFEPADLQNLIHRHFELSDRGKCSAHELKIETESGKRLHSGSCYRYCCP